MGIHVEMRRKSKATGSSRSELSPEDLKARIAALELARDWELVLKALAARGETVDRSITPARLRAGYTDQAWQALIREGQAISR